MLRLERYTTVSLFYVGYHEVLSHQFILGNVHISINMISLPIIYLSIIYLLSKFYFCSKNTTMFSCVSFFKYIICCHLTKIDNEFLKVCVVPRLSDQCEKRGNGWLQGNWVFCTSQDDCTYESRAGETVCTKLSKL